MSNSVFFGAIVAFVFGIIFGIKELISFGGILILLLILGVIFLVGFRKMLIAVLCISFVFGFLRVSVVNKDSVLEKFVGKKVELEVLIIEEPDVREKFQHVVVEEINSKENIRITLSRFKDIKYGDTLKLRGKLELPENFENENGITFDYVNYLGKSEIYTTMFFPEMEMLESVQASKTKHYLFEIKEFTVKEFNENLPSPHAELISGILLGTKQALGEDLLSDFRRTGLIHIVVLSGFNVSIIVLMVMTALSSLPRIPKMIVGILIMTFFIIMVGAGATVIRAGIMTFLALFAKAFYHNTDLNRSLFFAGFLMILINPLILLYDPSFQLSFLATIGLVNFSPYIERKIVKIPGWCGREIISATVATQIAVTPLLIFMTGEVSVVSTLVNLLVLPIIPFVMLVGLIVVVFSKLPFVLSFIPTSVLFWSLEYVLHVVKYFSQFDWAVLKLI